MNVRCDRYDKVEILRESRTDMSHAFSWWEGILYWVMMCHLSLEKGLRGKIWCVTRLPLKASEFYANYLFKFLQIETLILVKNSTSNELSYCIRNFKCEEFFQTSLYIDIGKCWSLQTLEDRRLQRSRIQQKVLDRHLWSVLYLLTLQRIQKKPHPCPRGGFRQGFFVEVRIHIESYLSIQTQALSSWSPTTPGRTSSSPRRTATPPPPTSAQ